MCLILNFLLFLLIYSSQAQQYNFNISTINFNETLTPTNDSSGIFVENMNCTWIFHIQINDTNQAVMMKLQKTLNSPETSLNITNCHGIILLDDVLKSTFTQEKRICVFFQSGPNIAPGDFWKLNISVQYLQDVQVDFCKFLILGFLMLQPKLFRKSVSTVPSR